MGKAGRQIGTRAALLRAAAGLLEDRGMAAVTLRSVGERAGVSRQAPYKHFADKEELLSVVAAGYFDRVEVGMGGPPTRRGTSSDASR